MYYDRDGEPITMAVWLAYFHRDDYKIIAKTNTGREEVSTVWLGLDHGFSLDPEAPPIIFETMVFALEPYVSEFWQAEMYEDLYGIQERYSTEEQALAGHKRIADMLLERAPKAPPASDRESH